MRKYARDLVDTRRSVAEFFLPLALVILGLTFFGTAQMKLFGSSLWLALVLLIVLDSVVLAFRLRRGLARSLPDVSHKGATLLRADAQHADPPLPVPPPRIKGRGSAPSPPDSTSRRPGLTWRERRSTYCPRSWTFVISAAAA